MRTAPGEKPTADSDEKHTGAAESRTGATGNREAAS